MHWLIRAMKDLESSQVADEFGRLTFEGDIRSAAREAARLAEQHGWKILVYLDVGGGLENWMFSCRRLGSGAFIWEGDDDIVEQCERRHQCQ